MKASATIRSAGKVAGDLSLLGLGLLPFILLAFVLNELILTEQGQELLSIVNAQSIYDATFGIDLALLLLASYVVALRIGLLLADVKDTWPVKASHQYDAPTWRRKAVFIAVLINSLATPSILLLRLPLHPFHLLLLLVLVPYTLIEYRCFVQSQKSDMFSRGGRSGITQGLSAVILLILFAYFLAATLGTTSAVLARTLGTLGIVVSSGLFWASLITLTLGVIPARFGWPPLYVLLPIFFLFVSPIGAYESIEEPRKDPQQDQPDAANRPSAEDHFKRWLLSFEDGPRNKPLPIFLIAAEGGGLRAAYWSGGVLTALDERTNRAFSAHTFAYSGVSGGALGIAVHNSRRVNGFPAPTRTQQARGEDFLSPIVARLFLIEPLRTASTTLSNWFSPRGVIFEKLLEESYQLQYGTPSFAKDFLSEYSLAGESKRPIVVLNATDIESGGRLAFSNARLESHIDAFSRLGPVAKGMKVSEVVHHSARFPLISPPGRLVDRAHTDKQSHIRRHGIVDGGYFENSGTNELFDIYSLISRLRNYSDDQHSECIDTKARIENRPNESNRVNAPSRSTSENCSQIENAADSDTPWATKTKNLRARIQIHVVVLRSTPNESRSEMDIVPRFDEITGPVTAIMSGRTYRSAESIDRIKRAIVDYNRSKFSLCEHLRPSRECHLESISDSLTIVTAPEHLALAWSLSSAARSKLDKASREVWRDYWGNL